MPSNTVPQQYTGGQTAPSSPITPDFIKKIQIFGELSKAGLPDKVLMPLFNGFVSDNLFAPQQDPYESAAKSLSLEKEAAGLYSGYKQMGMEDQANRIAQMYGLGSSGSSVPSQLNAGIRQSNKALLDTLAAKAASSQGNDRQAAIGTYTEIKNILDSNPDADVASLYKKKFDTTRNAYRGGELQSSDNPITRWTDSQYQALQSNPVTAAIDTFLSGIPVLGGGGSRDWNRDEYVRSKLIDPSQLASLYGVQ